MANFIAKNSGDTHRDTTADAGTPPEHPPATGLAMLKNGNGALFTAKTPADI
jgi:hypothetical protein